MKSILARMSELLKSALQGSRRKETQSRDETRKTVEENVMQTEAGPIPLRDFTGNMPDPDIPRKIEPLTEEQQRLFSSWQSSAPLFLITYCEPKSVDELRRYDEAFKAWQNSPAKVHSNQAVIDILGAYLGQRMVDDLGMKWVQWTDSFGHEYAVVNEPMTVIAYPFSSVSKRVEDGEYEFVHGVYHIIKTLWTESLSRDPTDQSPRSQDDPMTSSNPPPATSHQHSIPINQQSPEEKVTTAGNRRLRSYVVYGWVFVLVSVLLCGSYYLRARLHLGCWPTYGNPDPKYLEWNIHHFAVMLSLLLINPCLLLSGFVSLVLIFREDHRFGRISLFITGMIWLGLLFLLPRHPMVEAFLGWYMD